MRNIIIGLLLLLSFGASAQWQQTGSKVRYVNGLGIPTKDTAAGVSADSSQILIRPADSSLYIKYKRTWLKVGSGGTIGGSGTINRVPKFTAGTTIGNSSIVDSASAVAMTINASGNVGIGTTNPGGYKLNVNDSSYFNGQININAILGNAIKFRFSTSPFIQLFQNSTIYGFYNNGRVANDLTIDNTTGYINATTRLGISLGFGVNPNAALSVGGTALINTNTDNGVDKLQVNGSAIASTLKVNTSGQTVNISSYYNGGTGNNIWIGGGGLSGTSASAYNISLGSNALLSNTSGEFNAAVGAEALQNNTTGFRNMAFGSQALKFNTTGNRNMAIGQSALEVANASDNAAVGSQTLISLTSGGRNVGIGSNALFYATTGSSNVAVGTEAGKFITGGSNNVTSGTSVYLGDDTRASANGNSNEIVIGHNTNGLGSNTATLGNSSITKTFLRGNTMVNTTTDNGVDELQVNGSISGIGFKQAYVAKTGAYTATNDDYVIDCTSGTFTVTLPASSGRTGRILIIKNSGAGTITVDGNGAETIDGAATYAISVQYGTIQIMSDGTNWKIIAKF
jgi:hypothetical protein